MQAKSILDADMATLARWMRAGLGWWGQELRALAPAVLVSKDRTLSAYIDYRGTGNWAQSGTGATLPVLIDPALCLVRAMTLPSLGAADLQRLVELDADRILPIPSDQMVIAAQADPADRTSVSVVGIRRDTVRAMVGDLREAGIAPARVALAEPGLPGRVAQDLTSALARAGLIEPSHKAALPWWVLVGFLFALNLALLVGRDMQEEARLQALVDAQQPAVNAARAISRRIARGQHQMQELAERRQRQDALGVLAAVTQALPQRAWVQRYAWDGRTVRLSGYKRAGVDVMGALRKSPWLADVSAADAEAVAEVPTGQPFDITARVRPAAPRPAAARAGTR